MKKLKYLLFAIIPVLLFTSRVNAISIEMYQDRDFSALGYKECILAQCWDKYKNVKYNGELNSINFYSPVSISPLNKYTLTINFLGDDFISSKSNDVVIQNDTSCSIVSTSTDGNSYSRFLKVQFVCGQSSDYFKVIVGGVGESPITGGPSGGTTTYGISSIDIVNETASETDKIIAGNDKNTDNIINNNDKNTNTIIDKNKENTDKILDSNKDTQNVIKDQFNSCRDSVNLLDLKDGTYSSNGITAVVKNGIITLNGTSTALTFLTISTNSYINWISGQNYTVSLFNVISNKNLKFRIESNGVYDTFLDSVNNTRTFSYVSGQGIFTNKIIIRVENGTTLTNFVVKPQIQDGSSGTEYEQYGQQICSNKLDEQTKTSKGILGKLSSLFDWLTNKDSADVSGANKIAGYLPPGPLDSIINLPLTFLQNLNTNLSKTCTPLNVPMPYVNKTVQIPCLNTIFNQIDGLPNFWNWVGTIASVMILYRYLIKLYKYYDDLTTLKANFLSDWGSI